MTDLNMHRLTIGQPGLDPLAPARGVGLALVLAALAWMLICGLAYLAVWG